MPKWFFVAGFNPATPEKGVRPLRAEGDRALHAHMTAIAIPKVSVNLTAICNPPSLLRVWLRFSEIKGPTAAVSGVGRGRRFNFIRKPKRIRSGLPANTNLRHTATIDRSNNAGRCHTKRLHNSAGLPPLFLYKDPAPLLLREDRERLLLHVDHGHRPIGCRTREPLHEAAAV